MVVPHERRHRSFGIPMAESLREETAARLSVAADIGWAVRAAARFWPWRSTCLVMTMAARRMLSRRGIPVTLYLGVRRIEDASGMAAHAWLRCGPFLVVGKHGHEQFTVVATFASACGPADAGRVASVRAATSAAAQAAAVPRSSLERRRHATR